MSNLRPAATVVLIRDASTPSGLEVFMLKRNRRMGFLPNAWVFPGGRVDASDDLTGHAAVPQAPDDLAFRIAAVRETFEEAGIWLGERPPPDDTRDPLNRGELDFGALITEHGSSIDLGRLVRWSWWITPEAEPKRYDTRFYAARCADVGSHDTTENVDSRWVCPAWAVHHGSVREFPMAPPTWWTLFELAQLGSVDAVFAAAPTRPELPILPIMRFEEQGMQLLLPGHPDHPQPPFPGLPYEVGYEDGQWVAIRDGQKLRSSQP